MRARGRRSAVPRVVVALMAVGLAACGRQAPAPVPVTDAPISPGTPTTILVPVVASPPASPGATLAPAPTPVPTPTATPIITPLASPTPLPS